MSLELIMKHMLPDVGAVYGYGSRGIEAVLTCCPGESGEDNEDAKDDTELARLEWEGGVAVTLQLCCGTAVANLEVPGSDQNSSRDVQNFHGPFTARAHDCPLNHSTVIHPAMLYGQKTTTPTLI